MIITLRDYIGNEIDLDWGAAYLPVQILRSEKLFVRQYNSEAGLPVYWQCHIDSMTDVLPVAIRRVPDDETMAAPPADYVVQTDDAGEPIDIDA